MLNENDKKLYVTDTAEEHVLHVTSPACRAWFLSGIWSGTTLCSDSNSRHTAEPSQAIQQLRQEIIKGKQPFWEFQQWTGSKQSHFVFDKV